MTLHNYDKEASAARRSRAEPMPGHGMVTSTTWAAAAIWAWSLEPHMHLHRYPLEDVSKRVRSSAIRLRAKPCPPPGRPGLCQAAYGNIEWQKRAETVG